MGRCALRNAFSLAQAANWSASDSLTQQKRLTFGIVEAHPVPAKPAQLTNHGVSIMSALRTACVLSLFLISPANRNAPGQDQPKTTAASPRALLTVKGEVERQLELTAEEFAKLPRQSVQAKDHQGKEGDYEGVAIVELLKSAGLKFGQDLRGKALAN
jgi:hypothetical protein